MTSRVQLWRKKYQHIIMPVALIGGFVVDIFTLNRIDQFFDNALLIFHLVVVGSTIALLFSRDTSFGRKFLSPKRIGWLQAAMVFSFGALFSGFIIFYTRSGSLLTSWPFVLCMLVLMLSTEFRKRYFNKLTLQILIFYLAIVSWIIFFIPVLIKKMGPWVFVFSTLVSFGILLVYLKLLKRINLNRFKMYKKKILVSTLILLGFFNLLYFTNIIPPIPLSMKFDAVYYNVEKIDAGGYKATYQAAPWYQFWQKRDGDMQWRDGEDLFVFTQVFAPTNLNTTIRHLWQEYDRANRRWITRDTIDLPITGGRNDGYRGFTRKENLAYGKWRVRTETTHGQTLGITKFSVVPPESGHQKIMVEEL